MRQNDLSQLLVKDRHFLKNLQVQMGKNPRDQSLKDKFHRIYEESHRRYLQNLAALPQPTLSADLPVLAVREELKKLIGENQVVIVSGETGSGKTTQLPQICLSLGLGAGGLIGHTQPRRIAAKSVASRLAEELNCPLGGAVGYQVRFDEQISEQTRIKLMTDGLLLAETINDRFLNRYEVIIVDEAHERSLNIDFLLGYLRRLMDRRRDLKIIITSATIDSEKFSRHFNGAPVINVSGRSYPVEVRYREPQPEEDLNEQIAAAVQELDRLGPGDILVFCATEREILDAQKHLEKLALRHTEILPLFGRLSLAAQQAVFHPKGGRRIILTTNVAETSLTVPRIRYVIDTGRARISRYSLRTKTQRLPIEPISQASANQRAGRCGRLSAGVCLRLYSREDFEQRPEFTEPEILRTNLAAVILQMLFLKLGAVDQFPFVDVPDQRQINDGYRLLFELQAVDEKNQLTALGRKMALLPIDPRFARIVFAAKSCLQEALIILAFLSIQDPRERPLNSEALADQRQGEFVHGQSDFQTILNLFVAYQQQRRDKSGGGLRSWCKHYFLNFLRMREWRELVNELLRHCREQKLTINDFRPASATEPQPEGKKGRLAFNNDNLPALHEALLTGFLDQVGLWDDRRQDYLGTRGRHFRIFPASALAKKRPPALFAATIIETQQIFARVCAPIDLALLERLAAHLCKSQLQNPHWSKRAGNVMGEETVSLYGLPLVQGRKKPFASQDPVLAHQIFIEEALVPGEINSRLGVLEKNRELIQRLEELEDMTRSRAILDEQAIGDFYRQRLPERVHSVVSLEQWAKENGEDKLLMREADLLQEQAETAVAGYPDKLVINGYQLPLVYEFEPGSASDGVTLLLPLTALNGLREEQLERLVPAMLEEKIAALLRTLPKLYRRQLVPIPQMAKALAERLANNSEPLLPAIARELKQMKGTDISPSAFALEHLEPHHRMNIRLLDGEKVIAEGRDLAALQAQFSAQAAATFQSRSVSKIGPSDEPVKQWLWEQLPKQERLRGNIVAYPALTVVDGQVFLRLHDNAVEAERAHRRGVEQLLLHLLHGEAKYLQKNLPQLNEISLYYHKLSPEKRYFDDFMAAAVRRCLGAALPRSRAEFDAVLSATKKHLVGEALKLHGQLQQILALYSDIKRALGKLKAGAARADMERQLNRLIYPNFIAQSPLLAQLERYLRALSQRLAKMPSDPLRDLQRQQLIEPWEKIYGDHGSDPAWLPLLQLLEEYRVQLFAQELGTAQKVSPQRLEQLVAELSRG